MIMFWAAVISLFLFVFISPAKEAIGKSSSNQGETATPESTTTPVLLRIGETPIEYVSETLDSKWNSLQDLLKQYKDEFNNEEIDVGIVSFLDENEEVVNQEFYLLIPYDPKSETGGGIVPLNGNELERLAMEQEEVVGEDLTVEGMDVELGMIGLGLVVEAVQDEFSVSADTILVSKFFNSDGQVKMVEFNVEIDGKEMANAVLVIDRKGGLAFLDLDELGRRFNMQMAFVGDLIPFHLRIEMGSEMEVGGEIGTLSASEVAEINAEVPEPTIMVEIDGKLCEFVWFPTVTGDPEERGWYWRNLVESFYEKGKADKIIEENKKLIPEPFIEAGGVNGEYYLIHPVTGEKVKFSTLFIPGWGDGGSGEDVDFYEATTRQSEIMAGIVESLISFKGLTGVEADSFRELMSSYDAYPVVIVSPFDENETFSYQQITDFGNSAVGDSNFGVLNLPTNLLAFAIPKTGNEGFGAGILINQGKGVDTENIIIQSGDIIEIKNSAAGTNKQLGTNDQVTTAIIIAGKTTAESYLDYPGSDSGIGERDKSGAGEPEFAIFFDLIEIGNFEGALEFAKQFWGWFSKPIYTISSE